MVLYAHAPFGGGKGRRIFLGDVTSVGLVFFPEQMASYVYCYQL